MHSSGTDLTLGCYQKSKVRPIKFGPTIENSSFRESGYERVETNWNDNMLGTIVERLSLDDRLLMIAMK